MSRAGNVELSDKEFDALDPRRSDLDLWHWEITVHGKARTTRTVTISHAAARALDRYLRVRARHGQSYRPQLWPGTGNRGPLTASGIYQVTRQGDHVQTGPTRHAMNSTATPEATAHADERAPGPAGRAAVRLFPPAQ